MQLKAPVESELPQLVGEMAAPAETVRPIAVLTVNPVPLRSAVDPLGPWSGVSVISGFVTVNGRFGMSMPVPAVMPWLPLYVPGVIVRGTWIVQLYEP